MAFTVVTYDSEEKLETALNAITTETIVWVMAKGAKFTLVLETV